MSDKHRHGDKRRPRPEEKKGSHKRERRAIAIILLSLITLGGLVTVVLNFGEVGDFAEQAARARPRWLLLAVGAQICAFLVQSLVWWIVLHKLGSRKSLADLFALSVGKLFADQAVPSAGISGAFFLLHALGGRGVAREDAFTVFIFGAVSFITAFLIAAAASFAYIAFAGGDGAFRTTEMAALTALGVLLGVILFVFLFLRFGPTRRLLTRIKPVGRFLELARIAAMRIGEAKWLFFFCVLLQLVARAFDGATLWVAFFAIGEQTPFLTSLIGVNIASAAATAAPTPMGIGTFEAGLLASLTALGISVESALTTTLLYRGLSLWAPLGIGFFLVQRELLRRRQLAEHR